VAVQCHCDNANLPSMKPEPCPKNTESLRVCVRACVRACVRVCVCVCGYNKEHKEHNNRNNKEAKATNQKRNDQQPHNHQ
jgi:hypothetical protein